MLSYLNKKMVMVDPQKALPGRAQPIATATQHYVFKTPLAFTLAPKHTSLMVGMGCFWGAERKFWQLPGVVSTAVGYSAGYTPNPTYEEVCSGLTGHNEVVRVIFDTTAVSLERVLKVFWESHDPTQGMRQGNDAGTQYRSGVYLNTSEEQAYVNNQKVSLERKLATHGFGAVTTEVLLADTFYYAEAYHQQYLAKNPNGYCGLGGTGVTCPVGVSAAE